MASANKKNDAADTQAYCLGTRLVVLIGAIGKDVPTQGLLLVKPQQQETEAWTISICTESAVYTNTITISEVKVTDDHKDKIPAYFLQDNGEHPAIQISFEYESSSSSPLDASIRVVVKQRLGTGHMKPAFSGSLPRVNTQSPVLNFVQSIGKSFNAVTEKLENADNELTDRTKSMNEWKDTAKKLDQDWQGEKDRLLRNFLELLKEIREQSSSQINQLKEELRQAKSGRRGGGSNILDRVTFDAPDDLDQPNKEPIDMDTAMTYATGRSSSSTRTRDPILDPSEAENNLNKYRKKFKTEPIQKKKKATSNKSIDFTSSDEENPPQEDEARSKKRLKSAPKSTHTDMDIDDDSEVEEKQIQTKKPPKANRKMLESDSDSEEEYTRKFSKGPLDNTKKVPPPTKRDASVKQESPKDPPKVVSNLDALYGDTSSSSESENEGRKRKDRLGSNNNTTQPNIDDGSETE